MTERPKWATAAWLWLTDDQYDPLIRHDVPDEHWRWTAADLLERAGVKALCLWFGHEPIPDQCTRPEHDFCVYCRKSMPNGFQRPAPVTPTPKED